MIPSRKKPLLVLAFSILAMLGLAVWNVVSIHRTALNSNARWVERASGFVEAERQSFTDRLADYPEAPNLALFRLIPERQPSVAAVLITDIERRRTDRWVKQDRAKAFGQLDPRLVNLELSVLQTRQPVSGPIVILGGVPYMTTVRPLDKQRVLVAFADAGRLWKILDEETRDWRRRCWIYDTTRTLIYGFGDASLIQPRIGSIVDGISSGHVSGRLPPDRERAYQWVTTFHYDRASDWIFVVSQPAPWVYAPLLFFFLSLIALVWLARLPVKAQAELRLSGYRRELAVFARRVDRFVRGDDPAIKEPPYPFQELTPIVHAVRWLLPQWKKAEAYPRELALERKLLALLIESLPEAILFFNAQGAVQLSNELGRAFLALQQEAGREYKMVSGTQVPRGFLEPFAEPVFTGQQRNLGKEVEVGWADGKHLYRVWVEAVEDAEGKVTGFIVVVRDITFRRQWEYVQEQVLSGITHDLRGPLSAVMGYLDLMRRQVTETANPKLAEYLKLARDAGVRLTQMVSDILDVVRFEQGKIDLQIEPIQVSAIFQRLRNIFGVTADQKKVTLRLEENSLGALNTYGDPKLLERIFDNLVGNAIKFTPSGGTITVSATRAEGRMIFSVADTGRGIPREAQSRIFDKFQQVRPGDRSSGYGLGLAVVKFIVEAHHGEIRVESEVGKGSTFTFWVPDQPPLAASNAK